MSKRYVIQVLDTITDENATDVYEVEPDADGDVKRGWFNLAHPAGGDWLTRSKTTALNDAVKLVFAGETRPLRIAVSKPVYSTNVVPELDVAAAVALAKQIAQDIADEAAKLGVTLDEVAKAETSAPDYESDDVFADGPEFEIVDESDHEFTEDGSCCFTHRKKYLEGNL